MSVSPRRSGGVLAIDHGTKRTGFAATDALRLARTALDPYSGTGDSDALLAHVAKLLDERSIATFLVGLPMNMDGSDGPRAADVRAFAARLRARFSALEIVLYDERLTTKAAEELLRASGKNDAERRRLRDSYSALVLLSDWIESGEPR